MSRKKARDNAFKCIYELEFDNEKNVDKLLEFCYTENEDRKSTRLNSSH